MVTHSSECACLRSLLMAGIEKDKILITSNNWNVVYPNMIYSLYGAISCPSKVSLARFWLPQDFITWISIHSGFQKKHVRKMNTMKRRPYSSYISIPAWSIKNEFNKKREEMLHWSLGRTAAVQTWSSSAFHCKFGCDGKQKKATNGAPHGKMHKSVLIYSEAANFNDAKNPDAAAKRLSNSR